MIHCHVNNKAVDKKTAQCKNYGAWTTADFVRLKALEVCVGCEFEFHICPVCGHEVSYNHKATECAAEKYKVSVKKFMVTAQRFEGTQYSFEVVADSIETVHEQLENVMVDEIVKVEEAI
jgi:hypothetical protein